jgi:UDP-glucose 4-epimerase
VINKADYNSLPGQTVLITGGRGFLGANLRRRLDELNVTLHATSRVRSLQAANDACWHQVDFSRIDEVRRLLDLVQPDIVFHLAGHGVGSPELDQLLPAFQQDLAGSVNLLTAAAERKSVRRIVLAASLEEPALADAHIPPATPYAAAKWATSMYARMFHALYKTPVVMVRPFMSYGPGQRDHKLIPHVVLSLLQEQSPRLSSGNRLVDWVFVEDVIEGMIAAALVPGIEGETFDLGSGELVSIRSVIEKLTAIVGSRAQPVFGVLPDRPMERVRVADVEPAAQKLGWRSVTPLEAGLKTTVTSYQHELRKTAAVRA